MFYNLELEWEFSFVLLHSSHEKSSNWLRWNKNKRHHFVILFRCNMTRLAWCCDSFCWMECGCAESYRALYSESYRDFVVLWQAPRYIIIISSSSTTTVPTSSRRRESPRSVQMWEQHGAEVITSSSSLLLQQVATLSTVKLERLDCLQLSTLPSQLPVHGRRVYYANC